MAMQRKVARIIQSETAPVGTFSVRRALPDRGLRSVGPWVFLDHFGPFAVQAGVDGVGAHPHAGIETVTYLLSGRQEHRDSAGHRGIVSAGGAQWMSAGRGIVHAEKPVPRNEAEQTLHGIQLWTSLPRALKMMPPRYRNIEAAAIPEARLGGATVRVVAGELAGLRGPADALMPLFLWHATIPAGESLLAEVPGSYEAGAYVISGEVSAGPDAATRAGVGQLVAFEGGESAVAVRNVGSGSAEVLFLGGAPAEGPLVFHGPFVMNSVEQVRAAEVAYRTGRMGELAD